MATTITNIDWRVRIRGRILPSAIAILRRHARRVKERMEPGHDGKIVLIP